MGTFLVIVMKNKHYSQEQIERLIKDPRIKHIDEFRWSFTFEFRLYLWKTLYPNFCGTTVRNQLLKEGFSLSDLNSYGDFVHHLAESFKRRKPCGSKNKIFGEGANLSADNSYNDYLLSTGKFVHSRKGVSFSEQYKNEIHYSYPIVSIRDYLTNDGFDVERIGYQRIYLLEKEFNGEISRNMSYSDDIIDQLKNHPYIKTITTKQIRFHNQFYNEASYLVSLPIDEILEVFDIDYHLIPVSIKTQLKYKINHWKIKRNSIELEISHQLIQIQRNINKKLNEIIIRQFNSVKSNIHSFDWKQRKTLCEVIKKIPHDNERIYTKQKILKLCGISKTNYYSILKNKRYGNYQRDKNKQDENDIQTIKKVIDYKGYPKGMRMIHMMMPRICDKTMSLNKIRRLCHKANIVCPVRQANSSRKSAQELLARNCKQNLLKRRFRLGKPGEILLTDVSYLKYGNNQTAYLSDIKDAVTGRIYAYEVSDSNDLMLVLNTIENLIEVKEDAIFHSDQGSLYLTDSFQNKIKSLGMRESMSRRGNCWDNAPKESYYGHFKDECSYGQFSSIEEVRKSVDEYVDYYNNERPQWTRNKMTPLEYENYLNQLSDEEYEQYLSKEECRYQKMMDNAVERARKRASALGA